MKIPRTPTSSGTFDFYKNQSMNKNIIEILKEKVALDYALKNNLFFEVLFEKDFYIFLKTVNEIV